MRLHANLSIGECIQHLPVGKEYNQQYMSDLLSRSEGQLKSGNRAV
jgi:hypothetical protein